MFSNDEIFHDCTELERAHSENKRNFVFVKIVFPF